MENSGNFKIYKEVKKTREGNGQMNIEPLIVNKFSYVEENLRFEKN